MNHLCSSRLASADLSPSPREVPYGIDARQRASFPEDRASIAVTACRVGAYRTWPEKVGRLSRRAHSGRGRLRKNDDFRYRRGEVRRDDADNLTNSLGMPSGQSVPNRPKRLRSAICGQSRSIAGLPDFETGPFKIGAAAMARDHSEAPSRSAALTARACPS